MINLTIFGSTGNECRAIHLVACSDGHLLQFVVILSLCELSLAWKLPPFAFTMLSMSCKMSLLLITMIDNIQCYMKRFTYFSFQLKTVTRSPGQRINSEFFNWPVICYNCHVWVDENGNPNVKIKTKDLNRQIDHHSYVQCFILWNIDSWITPVFKEN